jgi:hypothetical protein
MVKFGFGKKRKMAKLVNRYIYQKMDQRRSFEEQLGELDDRLKKEKIDLQERDRLIFLLQTQFYKQEEKNWKQIQEKYINPIETNK